MSEEEPPNVEVLAAEIKRLEAEVRRLESIEMTLRIQMQFILKSWEQSRSGNF